ncbi:uncharacterized protein LOC133192959 [Saccostrea echinata]|uniref:uncharacterized protein LOC133192959 n=1 Tax=Saccostrea echinata TaxID=191078 RepID=UPI002A7F2985|nr:uncharacterized protein LOC133192959 [Saccostrea echinata]
MIWDAKLEILKFPYSWAEKVEEEEKETERFSILNQTSQQEDTTREKVAEKGEATPKIALDYSSKTPELHQDSKAEDETKTKALEVSMLGTKQIKAQSLCDGENENDDYFVPRKLFLFGIEEFKGIIVIYPNEEISLIRVFMNLNRLQM